MDFPLWNLPASGLLIAAVAIIHVFISHFAVGGGLFLVVTEHLARRQSDSDLLAYVRRHSRFFVLVTLVGGAITGVGIWFTIALVHPAATSTLIQAFVWGWAIEWTFFFVEISAAIIYYYGWDRLDARTHETIGWIYFGAAWLSLAVINGVLSFMLTPGDWVTTHDFWDGILNPTYLPSVLARTAGAVVLAGIYAVATAAWMEGPQLKRRLARYAVGVWILPASLVLPVAAIWFLVAANGAGVPVADILGAPGGSISDLVSTLWRTDITTGHPIAQRALTMSVVAGLLVVIWSLVIVWWRPSSYGRSMSAALMVFGFAAIGGLEWLREDLRKPYVISQVMFVNGVRVEQAAAFAEHGLLPSARWARPVADIETAAGRTALGREVFRLQCSACHTLDGYLAIRPLTSGASAGSLHSSITKLHMWRGRRMPPVVGNESEREVLVSYLMSLHGQDTRREATVAGGDIGREYFDDNCAMCHGASRDFAFKARGRSADDLYELIGRLPQVNDAMSPFEGSEAQRRAVASFMATLDVSAGGGGGVQ